VVDPVLEEYGKERLAYILACTLQYKSWDGRFSIGNKAWAESIPVGENINRGVDANMDYVVESHPAVLDGFVNFARMRFEELEQTQETSIPQQSAEKNLESYDREIAYRIEATGQYLAVQTATDGVDYTFYDKDFREIDGGIYDNPDISMEEAIGELLADEGLSMEDCHEIDYDDLLEKAEAVEQAEIQKLREKKEISQISDRTNPEAALNGQSCAGIEETILCYAQAQIDEMGLSEDVKLIGARVYGSRTRKDLFTEESDIDVVLSYSGDMREDTFFNLLHEEKFQIAGIPVDINPISPEKTGTLEEFMEKAEQYLDMKEAEIASRTLSESRENEQRDETQISFYVAECMEFTVMGEYHDNLTLEEAVELYDKIPADRMHGGKGIGFCLEDGSIYDGEFELMSGGKVLKDIINEIPHYKDSPLVQKAIADLEAILEARDEKQIGQTAELEKPEKTAPEPEKSTPEGTGKKQSVLNALRERQAKLKAQEQNQPAEKTPGHKKGEQEL
jgi:predicted nucleotidyltransferase